MPERPLSDTPTNDDLLTLAAEVLDIESSRTKVIVAFLFIEALVMMPSALDPGIVGTLDLVFGSGMQMLGSLIAIVTVAWGLDLARMKFQLFAGESAGSISVSGRGAGSPGAARESILNDRYGFGTPSSVWK